MLAAHKVQQPARHERGACAGPTYRRSLKARLAPRTCNDLYLRPPVDPSWLPTGAPRRKPRQPPLGSEPADVLRGNAEDLRCACCVYERAGVVARPRSGQHQVLEAGFLVGRQSQP